MMGEYVAKFLAQKGHGAYGGDIFLGFQPDEVDNCLTVYDESTPVLPESHGLGVDQFGIQILVRDNSYTAARDKAMAVYHDLAAFGGQFEPNAPQVTNVFVDGVPTSIGKDEKGRNEWTMHFRLRVENPTEHRL